MAFITTTIDPPSPQVFEQRASQVMQALREAYLGLIEALPRPANRAADLEKSLKLSRTLAWQVYRVATAANPLSAAGQVPGPAAFRQVQRAARAAGVPADRLEAAAEAMAAFDAMVEEHAGDRATLVTMIDSIAGREADGIDLKMRRQAFRINSQAWGVQVRTFLACGIIHPGRDASVFDMALLRGLRHIRRLRPGPPLRLSSQRVVDAHRAATEPHAVSAEESPAPPLGPNLLLDFCTKPRPQLETRAEDGCVHTFLRETPLGNAGMQTLYVADVTRDIEWKSSDGPNHHLRTATIMKPIEALVLDTLIHRDMFDRLEPAVSVFGSLDRLGETDPYRFREDETLPVAAEVEHLGSGPGVLPTAHVPRYREMVETVCRDAGWDAAAFDAYRCVVQYPLLNTMVQVRFDLPRQGNW